MSNDFTTYTIENAPEASKATLESASRNFGMVPNLLGVLAESPAAIKAYTQLGSLVGETTFTTTQRHIIWLTINAYHECHYCMAGHSAMATADKVDKAVIDTARAQGVYDDPTLEALKQFTLQLLDSRGWASEKHVQSFLEAGFSKENILEILVFISHKVLSNYTNHLADTPVDDAFKAFEIAR